MTAQRIVLFGGSGFLGGHLQESLGLPLVAPSRQEADLTDPDSLRRVLQASDIVINAAGYANSGDTTGQGTALFELVNVQGVSNLASAACEAGVGHVVHLGSIAAMGKWRQQGVTEEMLAPVVSHYAASKLAGERVLARWRDRVPVTILRPTSVFGEGGRLAGMLCRIISRGTVPLPDGGSALIPLSYVGNFVHAVSLTLGNRACLGETFIVGDRQSHRLRDVVSELARALRVKIRILSVPGAMCRGVTALSEAVYGLAGRTPVVSRGRLDFLSSSVSYSVAKLNAATGYEPPFSLEEACNRIAEWYRQDGHPRA